MAVLPRFIGLKSNRNQKYLRYVNEDGATKGFVQSSGDQVVLPKAKFAVEMATGDGNDGLVHIRSTYNNKYWQRRSEDSSWIVAGAKEAEDDRSKWSCTLFEPLQVQADDDDTTFRFRHAQLQKYVTLLYVDSGSDFDLCIIPNSDTASDSGDDLFTVTDLEALVILPPYVAFKGDNGKYLDFNILRNLPFNMMPVPIIPNPLHFTSDDIGDEKVAYEVVTRGDGSVSFEFKTPALMPGMSTDGKSTWLADDKSNGGLVFSWPIVQGQPVTRTWFEPVKVDDNVVALRNLDTKRFCRRDKSVLIADANSITKEAQFTVEEPIASRSIYGVDFRLEDARLYNLTPISVTTRETTNTTDTEDTDTITLNYTETKSSTWSNSTSLKVGFKMTFESGIPFILDAKIEVSGELSDTYQFGKTITTSEARSYQHVVKVPPKSKTKTTLLATTGHCDVPFSYIQHETRLDGTTTTTKVDGGVYTGINSYGYNVRDDPEPLDLTTSPPA